MQDTQVQSLGWEDPLQKELIIHFSILAWSIPWTEEPGKLLSKGPHVTETRALQGSIPSQLLGMWASGFPHLYQRDCPFPMCILICFAVN